MSFLNDAYKFYGDLITKMLKLFEIYEYNFIFFNISILEIQFSSSNVKFYVKF